MILARWRSVDINVAGDLSEFALQSQLGNSKYPLYRGKNWHLSPAIITVANYPLSYFIAMVCMFRFMFARVGVVMSALVLTQCAQPSSPPPAITVASDTVKPAKVATATSHKSEQRAAERSPSTSAHHANAKQLERLSLDWLRGSGLDPTHLSLYLFDLEQQRLIVEHRSKQPMQPASVMKLMTTSAALDLLGSTYRGAVSLRISQTDARALSERAPTAALYNLQQPLLLVGEGHNQLKRRDVHAIHETLQRLGIAPPRDVVLDRQWLPLAAVKPFDDNPWSWYNVAPDALLLEQNTQWYHLTATPVSAKTSAMALRIAGIEQSIVVDSKNVRWSSSPCRQNALQQLQFQWRGSPQQPKVEIRGEFPRSCYISGYAQLLPRDWGWQAAWQSVWPSARLVASAPSDTVEVARLEDEPLAVRIRSINKDSDNVQARTLFAALSTSNAAQRLNSTAQHKTNPEHPANQRPSASTDLTTSASVLNRWLESKGIDTSHLVFENGAGLSRTERLTTDALATLLRWQWQQPTRFEFVSSLPIAGVDGTLKTRFAGQAAENCARLKTGTLRDTTALAGYILPQNGQGPYVLVAIINDEHAVTQGVKALNAWVNQLCQAQ